MWLFLCFKFARCYNCFVFDEKTTTFIHVKRFTIVQCFQSIKYVNMSYDICVYRTVCLVSWSWMLQPELWLYYLVRYSDSNWKLFYLKANGCINHDMVQSSNKTYLATATLSNYLTNYMYYLSDPIWWFWVQRKHHDTVIKYTCIK